MAQNAVKHFNKLYLSSKTEPITMETGGLTPDNAPVIASKNGTCTIANHSINQSTDPFTILNVTDISTQATADPTKTALCVYGGAVMEWAGIDVPPAEADRWSARLAQIVDGFGSLSPAHALAWVNRARCDRWA